MPTGSISPFRPTGTAIISASTTSTSAALSGGGDSTAVTNVAASTAFVRFAADNAVVATTADMPVRPNSRVILSINNLIGYGAAILPAGSGTVYFSRGDGSVV